MTTTIHVGDLGTNFLLTIVQSDLVTPVDVSGATLKKIYFKLPDGSRLDKTAVFYTNGSDGILKYVAILNDIAVAGKWFMQGYVELPDGNYYSQVVEFLVEPNLKAVV